jgi:hypothetical protein
MRGAPAQITAMHDMMSMMRIMRNTLMMADVVVMVRPRQRSA